MAERPVFYDGWCGEPVSFYDPDAEVIGREFDPVAWRYLPVTRFLTREDAEARYGTMTDEEFGPNGGFRSVTFGKTKFISKKLGRHRREAQREAQQ